MHLLVVANETVTGRALIEAVERRRGNGELRVTVICPVNQPRRGYVVYEDTRRAAAGRRLDRTLSMLHDEGISAHDLVIANETVLGRHLLDKIRERAAGGNASFLIVSPQSDPSEGAHPEAERRLKRAVAELRGAGIDAHGQVAHPDPFSAALEAMREERVDEIIVSTFAPEKSGWLRRDLVERLRSETGVPVEHVVPKEGVPA